MLIQLKQWHGNVINARLIVQGGALGILMRTQEHLTVDVEDGGGDERRHN